MLYDNLTYYLFRVRSSLGVQRNDIPRPRVRIRVLALPFETQVLEPSPSLASVLSRKLRQEIESRRLRVGERFPTDAEIATAFGVSRTVVREAVSSLREIGLISTQRGRGSVVIANSPSPSFAVSGVDLESPDHILQLYEFRLMVELEAVALAASRRTLENLEEMELVLKRGTSAERLEDAIEADIAFHLAIARATQNGYFPRILATIRTATIARALMREDLDDAARIELYRGTIQEEHRAIYAAIAQNNASSGKKIIKAHLGGQRLKRLSEKFNR